MLSHKLYTPSIQLFSFRFQSWINHVCRWKYFLNSIKKYWNKIRFHWVSDLNGMRCIYLLHHSYGWFDYGYCSLFLSVSRPFSNGISKANIEHRYNGCELISVKYLKMKYFQCTHKKASLINAWFLQVFHLTTFFNKYIKRLSIEYCR